MFVGAVPSDEEFDAHSERLELADEYDASYLDLGEYAELSYREEDPDSGLASRRILIYDKECGLLTVRREFDDRTVNQITIEADVLHKNDYEIEEIGSISLETFGRALRWEGGIHLTYLTNMDGLWSRIRMEIAFL